MKVRIRPSAENDLADGFAFYERQDAGLGNYFLDALFADIDSLAIYGGIHCPCFLPKGPSAAWLNLKLPIAGVRRLRVRSTDAGDRRRLLCRQSAELRGLDFGTSWRRCRELLAISSCPFATFQRREPGQFGYCTTFSDISNYR